MSLAKRMPFDNPNVQKWFDLYYTPEIQSYLKYYLPQRFGNTYHIEASKTYLLNKLFPDSGGPFEPKCYDDVANQTSFMKVSIRNRLENYSDFVFGKKVPPTWIKKLGDEWVRLWKRLCLERRGRTELEAFYGNMGYREEWLRDSIGEIKGRIPKCGTSDYIECHIEGNNTIELSALGEDKDVITVSAESEAEALLLLLRKLLEEEHDVVHRLQTDIDLSAEQVIYLRAHYLEGATVSAIARGDNKNDYYVRSRISLAISSLRQLVAKLGVDFKEISIG